MREQDSNGALTVRAIAGSHVVILGMSVRADARSGLMGFAIKRLDKASGEERALPNFLLLEVNDKGADSDHSSWLNPLQSFQWSDFDAIPGRAYTYTVTAMEGSPGALTPGDSVALEIETEGGDGAEHAVFFNRGPAGWQAYEREFGQLDPDQVPDRAAYRWLSRGLEEALLAFIAQADGKGWALRVAMFEFEYMPVLDALWSAQQRGVDVKAVVDERPTGNGPRVENEAAIALARFEDKTCIARAHTSHTPHNKFVVLLHEGEPQQVWTGSTNWTKGGIFGHSNVGHLVREKDVAAEYLEYWNELSGDPEHRDLAKWVVEKNGEPERRDAASGDEVLPPKNSVGTVFSPRRKAAALDWYARLLKGAEHSAFLTCPFNVSQEFQDVFAEDSESLRYLILNGEDGETVAVARKIEGDPLNQVAIGAYIGKGNWHQWLEEHLTGYNQHAKFIHTKYLLIDPLGDDPIVVTGSANFSTTSTEGNDENMLVIRGDKAVADVYLGEFMRLFTAFRLRDKAKVKADQKAPGKGVDTAEAGNVHLAPDPSWADGAYVADSKLEKERLLFSGAIA
jgi:phosphatidylserine/phosphatidylglycerophosphate/cardiolipin synthase-like enzyme